jgi:hypothetical protein
MPDLNLFPLPFWLVVLALLFFGVSTWRTQEPSLRLPMIAVLSTITVWYVVDVLYNDYAGYIMEIGAPTLLLAWLEVLAFVCTFGLLTPIIHRSFNKKYLGRPSSLFHLIFHRGVESTKFQNQIDLISRFLLYLWVALMSVALLRTNFDFVGLFMPYLGDKVDPWARGRIGAGFDSLLAAAGYFQIGLTGMLGLCAALSRRSSTASLITIVYFLTLPIYLFDRTRSTMLATLLPGFLAFVFVRVRGGTFVKLLLLALGFIAVESWLKFVIESRGDQISVVTAFQQSLAGKHEAEEQVKHQGLNMFEELGFINLYFSNGSFRPSWGENYFAELVNPIPRSLWPGKPLIGLDFAVARGQAASVADNAAGAGATIATGMIGQGVVNFGRILGPVAAAIIMAYWAALLARQDLLGNETGRLFIYTIGLILTFNMGRDITLLVLYPFVFFYILLLVRKYLQPSGRAPAPQTRGHRPASTKTSASKPAVAVSRLRTGRRPHSYYRKR